MNAMNFEGVYLCIAVCGENAFWGAWDLFFILLQHLEWPLEETPVLIIFIRMYYDIIHPWFSLSRVNAPQMSKTTCTPPLSCEEVRRPFGWKSSAWSRFTHLIMPVF